MDVQWSKLPEEFLLAEEVNDTVTTLGVTHLVEVREYRLDDDQAGLIQELATGIDVRQWRYRPLSNIRVHGNSLGLGVVD
jgi:hypothetical protein